MDKGGGSLNVDKRCERGGGPRMWIKKFLIVNIINFHNVDKPRGGGWRQLGKGFFVEFC